MTPVYAKTAKGAEAIATRSRELPIRLRPVLIMVDGKRGLQELQALARQFGNVPEMLEQLVQGGFAQVSGATPGDTAGPSASPSPSTTTSSPPALPPTPVPAPTAVPAPTPATLGQAKQVASHLVLDLMGPNAEALCLRIETARTREEFIEAVRRAYAMLRELRGAAVADRFGAAIEARMPAD